MEGLSTDIGALHLAQGTMPLEIGLDSSGGLGRVV